MIWLNIIEKLNEFIITYVPYFPSFRVSDIFEILLLIFIVYKVITSLKNSRVVVVGKGLFILFIFYCYLSNMPSEKPISKEYDSMIIENIIYTQNHIYDYNKDGLINCIDYSTLFKVNWDSKYPNIADKCSKRYASYNLSLLQGDICRYIGKYEEG